MSNKEKKDILFIAVIHELIKFTEVSIHEPSELVLMPPDYGCRLAVKLVSMSEVKKLMEKGKAYGDGRYVISHEDRESIFDTGWGVI